MMEKSRAAELDALFAAAAEARRNAHAPYSHFAVGAAVSSASGRIYTGCNVENAAYPSGSCAEQGAIAAMVVAGERQIADIAILGDAPHPVMPCGACRQRILEFADTRTQIHAGNLAGLRHSLFMEELLPHGFGRDSLP